MSGSWFDLSVNLYKPQTELAALLKQLQQAQGNREKERAITDKINRLARNQSAGGLGVTSRSDQHAAKKVQRGIQRWPIGARGRRSGSGSLAFGWNKHSLRKGINLNTQSIDQYFSGDRSQSYDLNFTDVADYYDSIDGEAASHDMILPIDQDRFLFVKQVYGGRYDFDLFTVVPPYRHDIWCILIGGSQVKPVSVPDAFKAVALGVFPSPNVSFSDENTSYTEEDNPDTFPNPSLGQTHFPTAPACGYGITDNMRRIWEMDGPGFDGEERTSESIFSYSNRIFDEIDPKPLWHGTGSPASYAFLDLASGNPASPENFRAWWRLWLEDITQSQEEPYIPGLTWEFLRGYVPGAEDAPIFSLDDANEIFTPRYRVRDGSPPSDTQINQWWKDIPVGASLTYRRWDGQSPSGNVHEGFTDMTTSPDVWSEPITYPYPMKDRTTALEYGPAPILPFLYTFRSWSPGAIYIATWSNGAKWHTQQTQASTILDGYREIVIGDDKAQVIRYRDEGSPTEGVTLISHVLTNSPSYLTSGETVQYYWMTNGSWYVCPSTKNVWDVVSDGNVATCSLLSGSSTNQNAPESYPQLLVAADWGTAQANIDWLKSKGFTDADLAFG